MSDDRMNLEIGLDVKVTDLDQSKALRQEFERLNHEILQFSREIKASVNPLSSLGRARTQLTGTAARGGNAVLDAERQTYAELKRRFTFERRMAAQKRSEEATAAKRVREEQAENKRALQDQLNFSMRMVRERARAEADAERETRRQVAETAKVRDRANRKAISDARELERVHARAAERAARGAGQVRSGVGRVAGTAAATGAAAGYGAERIIDQGVSTRMDVDTAETQLKIFADTDDGRGGRRAITDADIRRLRRGADGLDNLSVRNGTSIPDGIRAYTEAAKAGLLDPMAQTRNILSAGNGLELDPTRTTKLLGTLARNIGAGATPDRLKRTLNAIAVGAREDPTQSNEIVEGLNRSQGLLAMSKGFTPEDLVAMVSGNQSVGIQPGKAGTAITALAGSILQGSNKFLDPKKRKELNFAARKLGFGSAKNMANQFAGENGKAVYYQIMKGLQGMAPQLRQQVADALSGGQWSDEDLQIVNGIDGQIRTDREIHDPHNAGFLDEANAKKMNSWQGLWNQSKTIFSLFWESFGAGFDGILRDINAFVLDLHGKFNYDRISGHVREGLDGLKAGLGFDTWKEALQSLVPGNVGDLGKKIGGFAKGFSSAIRDIAGAVSSVARMFGGGGGAESIGRLTGQFISLGAAALVLAPVMGVLGGLASIVLGIANAARAAAGVLGLSAGAAAGGGAVAGAMAGVARLLSGGFVLGLAGAIGNLRGEISTLVLNAVRPLISAIWSGLREAFSVEGLKSAGRAILDELTPAPLKRWLESGTPDQGRNEGSRWSDPPMRKSVEQLRDSLDQNVDALNEGARVQRQSLKATEDLKGLIHRASLNGTAGAIGDSIRDGAARAASPLSGSVGGGGGGGSGDPAGGSSGGGGGSATAPSGSAAQNFNAKAPGIMERLQKDLNLTREQAAGILGNLGHESDGFRAYGENGGKGPGVGWAQWTDPGRKARFLDYAQRNGLNPRSDEASYGFLKWELANTHAKALANLRRQTTVEGATRQFEADYEGAGVKHMDRRLGYAQQAFNMGGGSGSGSSPGPGGNPADVAAGYLGKGEHNDRPLVERFVGHNIRGAANAWCARFVDASLAAVGQTGTGSAVANSYLRWGKAITADMVQKGDVLVEHRGRGVDGLGGHVGFSTGRTRRGRNGELELEMIGGNTNDQVAATWEKASQLAIRRSTQVSDQIAAGQQRTQSLAGQANTAPPGTGNIEMSPPSGVTANVPLSNRSAPTGGAGAQGGGGGPQVNAPITINGHNKSPSELAAEVQRHLQDSMNRRTHDYDGFA